ncbi:unnamed protein product [Periconia digitata]|uniref:Uncharacterized protein n=1 Tax=Periconia digitata TaxID=1303443 RepID=A0A9W4XQC3_9PLEO|nr:unnamed protein product [Periconia digitata]
MRRKDLAQPRECLKESIDVPTRVWRRFSRYYAVVIEDKRRRVGANILQGLFGALRHPSVEFSSSSGRGNGVLVETVEQRNAESVFGIRWVIIPRGYDQGQRGFRVVLHTRCCSFSKLQYEEMKLIKNWIWCWNRDGQW